IAAAWWDGGYVTAGLAAVGSGAAIAHSAPQGPGFAGAHGRFHGRSPGWPARGAGGAPAWGGHWHEARQKGFGGWQRGGGGWRGTGWNHAGSGGGWHEARGRGEHDHGH